MGKMKKQMQQTSLDAFCQMKEELITRSKIVFEEIKLNPNLTARELARNLYFSDSNMVRPRVHELWRHGFIKANAKRKCKVTGKVALTWEARKDV